VAQKVQTLTVDGHDASEAEVVSASRWAAQTTRLILMRNMPKRHESHQGAPGCRSAVGTRITGRLRWTQVNSRAMDTVEVVNCS
jgi:hypothetical protein